MSLPITLCLSTTTNLSCSVPNKNDDGLSSFNNHIIDSKFYFMNNIGENIILDEQCDDSC